MAKKEEIITKSHMLGIIIGLVLIIVMLIYGLANKINCYEEIKEEDNCFEINSYMIYFDKEPILEFTLDNYNSMVSTQIIINETWHELILYPNNEEVCLDFTGEFKPVKIRNFNTGE